MGLSEREQQLLDDMERRLYQSEADVMQAGSATPKSFNMRSLALGILLALIGIGVMVGGVAAQQLWLGLIGFAAMLGGVVLAFRRSEDPADPGATAGKTKTARSKSGASFSDRMEERWNQRMEGDR
ncbi:MAG: DUF3040 domain-containing protein [Leucobacter sp.]|nr:DUF3040 domain-containing protein [Leucobacter sp.]